MTKKSTITNNRYAAANCTRINLKLNNRTDADVLAKLAAEKQSGGIQGYIKNLIRADLKRGE